ncbi:hypothetical protein DIPPA_12902 [Diplonema papillatum]|nr:hypothetical protein DIPPA_12902 [Diplonema papillatum]
MYDGCEGKGAASEPRPRRLDDPVDRQLLTEKELPRGAPADDDPTHVTWEELAQYGYRQDEAFRLPGGRSWTLYTILVVALATFIIVVDVVDCHGVWCRQQWGGGERLLRRYTRRLSTMYDGCEGKGAASEPRPRRLDDPVYRQLLAETGAGELPRGAPADDDPTHVPWEELAQYGYRQDEAFRLPGGRSWTLGSLE